MLNEQYEKWNFFAPIGLLVIGLGLSLTGNAIEAKTRGEDWFLKGTLGLVLFNAGIAIFSESVKARALYEMELQKLREND